LGTSQTPALHQPDSKSRPLLAISHSERPLYDFTYSIDFPFRISTQMNFTLQDIIIKKYLKDNLIKKFLIKN